MRILKSIILLLFCVLSLTNVLTAQTKEIKFKHLGVADGLSQTSIVSIVQDNEGYIWIGTDDGLNRYDGYNFKVYKYDPLDNMSISNNGISYIRKDKNGNLWIITLDMVLNKYNKSEDNFTKYMYQSTNDNNEVNSIKYIFEDKINNELWLINSNLRRQLSELIRFNIENELFTVYPYIEGDPKSLSSNHVLSMHQDKKGHIWIGTNKGLNRYDRENDLFVKYYAPTDNSEEDRLDKDSEDNEDPETEKTLSQENEGDLSNNYISAIKEDKAGNLWLGTWGGGLNLYDRESDSFITIKHNENTSDSLSNDKIISIFQTSDDSLWISTYIGLNKLLNPYTVLKTKQAKFKIFKSGRNDYYSIKTNTVHILGEDKDNNLWMVNSSSKDSVRFNNGVTIFNKETEKAVNITYSENNPKGLSNNLISSFYSDYSGNVWLGTPLDGINFYNVASHKFNHYKKNPDYDNSINFNMINSIHKDSRGNLWLGSWKGLDKVDTSTGAVINYITESNSFYTVTYIFEDSKHRLWLGNGHKGLGLYNSGSDSFKYLTKNDDKLNDTFTTFIYEDSNHNLWFSSNKGVKVLFDKLNKPFNKNNLLFKYIINDPKNKNSLSFDIVYSIEEDIYGNIWIGSIKGLNKLTKDEIYPDNDNFNIKRYIKSEDGKENSISDNFILSLLADKHGRIWIGTSQGGLNLLNIKTDEITYFTMKDGLSDNKIYAILEEKRDDEYTSIWFSTNNGITNLLYNNVTNSKEDVIIHNYFMEDGLQSREFNHTSCFKDTDGKMYFGGVNGFNSFYPDDVKLNLYHPKAIITEFKLIGKDKTFSINKSDPIVLTHKENFFSIEYNALDYSYPNRIKYAYKLEGLDNDWVYAENRRFVSYTGISEGKYTFLVKSTNSQGLWADDQSKWNKIHIQITPPFWKTTIAYIIYTVIALLAIFMLILWVRRRFKKKTLELKKERVEKERQQVLNQKLKNIDKIKDEFLTNTSHELKTPLNGIIGIAESLIDGACGEISPKIEDNLNLITQSGRRLFNLVNDILDYSKLKNDKLILNKKPVDIKGLCNIVITSLKSTLNKKSVEIINNVKDDTPFIIGDENRIEQILYNLVGNAVKFTDEGEIKIETQIVRKNKPNTNKKYDFIELSITDSGIGIPEDKLENIFNPFEQIDGSISKKYGGTGLGLPITKKLVEEHKGYITVESKVGKGSKFTVSLPVNKDSHTGQIDTQYKNKNTLIFKNSKNIEPVYKAEKPKLQTANTQTSTIIKPLVTEFEKDHINILVVDDELINRQVLKNHLALRNYNIIEAVNGQEALELIEKTERNSKAGTVSEKTPFDLVILDIMMPKISGYDVCKILREKYPIMVLPILLLTAKNTINDKVTGFNCGANDYITKPFNKNELFARVNTLIKLKQFNDSMKNLNNNLENVVKERTKELNEKNKDLEAFSYTISHDLKNQVSNVNVCSGFLKRFRYTQLDDKGNEMVNMIYETGKTMANILNGVINLFKTSYVTLKYQKVNLSKICEHILNSMTERNRERMVKAEIESGIVVKGDLNMLYIAMENLLTNAWKFTKNNDVTEINFGKTVINNNIYIYLKDNGIGFNITNAKNIFKEFSKLNDEYEGSGIGLATVKRIITKHGGNIFAESKNLEGKKETSFYFSLDLTE